MVTYFLTSKDLDTDDLLRPPNPEPPKRAAMKAVICEKAEGEGDVYRPEGMEGTIGETVMERNDETVPRALIMATKTAPLAYLTLVIDASNPQHE